MNYRFYMNVNIEYSQCEYYIIEFKSIDVNTYLY